METDTRRHTVMAHENGPVVGPVCRRCQGQMTASVRVPRVGQRGRSQSPALPALPVWRCVRCHVESPRLAEFD
jgi:hypothetical protein